MSGYQILKTITVDVANGDAVTATNRNASVEVFIIDSVLAPKINSPSGLRAVVGVSATVIGSLADTLSGTNPKAITDQTIAALFTNGWSRKRLDPQC